MALEIKKIEDLECGTPTFVDITVRDGIMNLATGTWGDIS